MASPTAVVSGDETAQSTHQDPLYAMPELAQICHFCLTFQAPLKLPSFSRTDLQASLIAGTTGDDRQVSLLAELHFKLVREQGAKLERMIQDWEKAVIRKVTDNWRLEFSSNPFDGVAYDDLSVAQRIQILNALCHWKLESCAEIHKHLAALQKESDSKALDALRATPIGYDDAGAAYWYFGDRCWVYAEDRPTWQSQTLQEYTVEFADAKRIRLSINFDPTGSVSSQAVDKKVEINGVKTATKAKLQISTLVEEEIDEDEEDEPLPTEEKVKEEKSEAVVVKTNDEAVESSAKPDVKKESPKMNISMLCSSTSSSPDSNKKSEPMEEDEHEVSEDRFMSTIVSTRDHVVDETTTTEPTTPVAVEVVSQTSQTPEPPAKEANDAKKSPTKKRIHDDEADLKKPAPEPVEEVAPKRRKTRFHDITRATDNTTAALVDTVNLAVEPTPTPVEIEKSAVVEVPTETKLDGGDGQAEDFEILCAACQRSYDRRYLDPPLDKRPMGEWRCFECLVNDARGWPRRRPASAKSPHAADGNEEEVEKASAKKKSSSSSKPKSKSGSSKSSSKKSSSSRSTSSSSKHKKSSSSNSSKKSSKKKKSSSSSSKHISSRHHRHHREEYANLLKLVHGRKRERLAIEEDRLDGSHLSPVPLDGPSGWRVVCSSVEGLRQITEQLVGGSLEQDRLRGRLIMILKVEEKQELERLKKHEQHLWQILPRRQSSRVAIGRMRSQNNSDESGADESGDDRAPAADSRSARSSRTRGGEGQARVALDRESRARRRRRGDGSDSESESDGENEEEPNVAGWINWSAVKGQKSLSMVCSGAVDRLLKEEIAELFARPVDPVEDGCPDYLTVITHPMDLGTIRQLVDDDFYTTWNLFTMDVDRVWSNCRKYNSPGMAVVEYADTLDKMFKQMRKEAERNGVRKLKSGDASVNGKQIPTAGSDEDDGDAAAKSSGDESVRKTKSDSSASEVSSIESDDSSDGSSGDSNAGSRAARKARQAASSRPARSASSSSRKPARPTRSAAPPSRGKPTRRRKAHASDSDEEEEADSHSESEEEEAESDSDDNRRKCSKRQTPPPQRRGSSSSTRSENRPTTGGKQPMSAPPPGEAPESASAGESTKRAAAHRNRIMSSDSSSSDESMKRDSSSSSEESDNESNGAPARLQPVEPARAEPSAAASAPPPPPSPPPPAPPQSGESTGQLTPTPSRGTRKGKPASSRQRVVGKVPHSPDSSSSYFSSSESESSGDSSDSDSD